MSRVQVRWPSQRHSLIGHWPGHSGLFYSFHSTKPPRPKSASIACCATMPSTLLADVASASVNVAAHVPTLPEACGRNPGGRDRERALGRAWNAQAGAITPACIGRPADGVECSTIRASLNIAVGHRLDKLHVNAQALACLDGRRDGRRHCVRRPYVVLLPPHPRRRLA